MADERTMSGDSGKVMHVINGEFYAGAERVQDLLAARLPALGYPVDFFCTKTGEFAARRHARDAGLHGHAMSSRIDVRPALRLAALLKERRYALVHTHTPRTALLGGIAAALSGVPMVHHVHSPVASDTETVWRNVRNAVCERLVLGRAARLLAVSSRLAERLSGSGFSRARIVTVRNGVPLQAMMRPARMRGQELVVGTAALFRPRKGIEVLLQALSLLAAQGYPVRLHAVGEFETPSYETAVRRLSHELGVADRVSWRGFAADVLAEYRRMHVFVLPSLYGEGLPMVVLEAMAVGLPVIASRIDGLSEIIRDGRDGFLVEPDDADGLARLLSLFCTQSIDADAIGDSAWRRQRTMFSDVSMAQSVAAVYSALLKPEARTDVS